MRQNIQAERVERDIIDLETDSNPAQYKTIKNVVRIDFDRSTLELKKPNRNENRKISIANKPFAKGAMRYAYRMEEKFGDKRSKNQINVKLVAKESTIDVPWDQRLQNHRFNMLCEDRARKLGVEFNKKAITVCIPTVEFLESYVYRIPERSDRFRYVAVERELIGKYVKYNGNQGGVLINNSSRSNSSNSSSSSTSNINKPLLKSEAMYLDVAQALSHWSYIHTNKTEMLVDIQGVDCTYTDPQIHSLSGRYGPADRKQVGMNDFLRTHKCGWCCERLGIKDRK